MPTATRKRKPKRRARQRTLFDAKPITPLAKWKRPAFDKAACPEWIWSFVVPPFENLELRRAALGW